MTNSIDKIKELPTINKMLSASIYNDTFIKKIVEVRLDILRLNNQEQYLELLFSDKDEQTKFARQMFVAHSRFFRTPLYFEYLKTILLPKIIGIKKKNNDPLRIWSAGCAAGEEAYSIAITVNDAMKSEKKIPIYLIATDISEKLIEKAETGYYPSDKMGNTKHKYLKTYFAKERKGYIVSDELKQQVVFAKYDLSSPKSSFPSESIFGSFDIIFCRNVLIYFNSKHVDNVVYKFHKAMDKTAWLFLGRTEKLPNKYAKIFSPVAEGINIYKKN